MGRDGIAFTFVVPGEGDILTAIEQRINRQLIRDNIEGFETTTGVAVRNVNEAVEFAPPTEAELADAPRRLNPMNRRVARRRR
jgi:ATP-dependent RNA helicase DeaD